MEDQEIREAKRARNFVWMAAENYEFEPLYLAYQPDGTADMYLNMIIGFSWKWYDQDKLEPFFHMLGGKEQELYEGLFWIGLENALYAKEIKARPVLEELRREYAESSVRRYQNYKDYAEIDHIRNAHCREILGLASELSGSSEKLLHALNFSPDWETEELIEQMKRILWDFFAFVPKVQKREKGVYFLQKVLPAFRSIGKMHATYVRTKTYRDPKSSGEGKGNVVEKTKHYLLQFSFGGDPEGDAAYVKGCFGKSLYPEYEQEIIEKQLCTGNHAGCHLLFTDGEQTAQQDSGQHETREQKEIRSFRAESVLQAERNREHYQKHRNVYENSIRRLQEKLHLALESEQEPFPSMEIHGRIRGDRVWKALYLDNPRVFEKREQSNNSGFSVDILIDASSSRKESQEQIAAQAYLLERALDGCDIPVQISSYCSIRGYTVVHLFRTYEETEKAQSVFEYVSAGNNRDGLALRAVGHLMEASPKERKLLLILTDASPEDDKLAGEGAFYQNREYTDALAVQDTAKEIQNLKKKGIQPIGIFMGSESGISAAREIFGRDFVRIQSIEEFAEVVGRILREKMER